MTPGGSASTTASLTNLLPQNWGPGGRTALVPDRGEATLKLCYLATADGEPQAGDDAAAIGWFAPDELPGEAEIEFRHQLQVFEDWRRIMGAG